MLRSEGPEIPTVKTLSVNVRIYLKYLISNVFLCTPMPPFFTLMLFERTSHHLVFCFFFFLRRIGDYNY